MYGHEPGGIPASSPTLEFKTGSVELQALIHEEDGSYWAEVKELPGCFASGATLDELKEALVEAISMCLEDGVEGTPVARVDEMRVLVA
jgi:predicted RNase H-like HicB family nuclease